MNKKTVFGVFCMIFVGIISVTACSPIQPTSTPTTASPGAAIQGMVLDEADKPISGAVVRIKTTQNSTITNSNGRFKLIGLQDHQPVKVTAWAPGYYIGGGENITPGLEDIKIVLHTYHTTDNSNYVWLPSVQSKGEGENQGCAQCHSSAGTEMTTQLPVDEWLLDAHSKSAVNPRFLSMYTGTDLYGHQSPLTRFGFSPDYGTFPLRPDASQPYYGPGYKLDFPNNTGNCAACHTPLAAIDNAYGIDPTKISGTELEGISCDFCHKISGVNLNKTAGLPNPNMPGVLSFDFLRPPQDHQFFAGPMDDVAPGQDTYLSIQQQSQFCAPCHNGVFWGTTIYNSFGEWLDSSYNNPETGKTCQACHMPITGATSVALPEKGGEIRAPETIFSHLMPGAMDKTLMQNAVTMTVSAHQEGEKINVGVTILNDKTGHDVPTDSPLRQLILLVKAQDPDGNMLQLVEGPTVPEWGGVGDSAKGYYAGLPGKGYAKILMELWTDISPTGAYWNPTRVVSDNRIAALASDVSEYKFNTPQKGPVIIEVTLLYRRAFIQLMDQKNWQVPDIVMQHAVISVSVQS